MRSAAYWAASVQASPYTEAFRDQGEAARPLPFVVAQEVAFDDLKDLGVRTADDDVASFKLASKGVSGTPLLPATPSDLPTFYSDYQDNLQAVHLQRLLTHEVEDIRHNRMLEKESESGRARALAACAQGASRLFTVVPTEPSLQLTDAEMEHAIQLRLGESLPGPLPSSECKCGSPVGPDPVTHFHSCRLNHKNSQYDRHQNIVRVLSDFARQEAGIAVVVEGSSHEHARPDLTLYYPDEVEQLDVSVTHPLVPSYVRGASQAQLSAAERRAKDKISKHAHKSRHQGYSFRPFVLETLGGFHAEAASGLSRLVEAATNLNSSRVAVFHQLANRLVVALARGNYRVCQEGLKNLKHPLRGD